MASHAQAVTGTGGTGADTLTQIGSNITLPAGGPWTIFAIWGNVARVTTIPDQGTGGDLHIDSVSGDLNPDPAPGNYPMIGSCVAQSANSPIVANALNMFPVNWSAPGKAVIRLDYRNLLAITTASAVSAGIIYGDQVPVVKPIPFCDSVSASFASGTEQSLGQITLSEKATRIIGVLADLNKGDAPTAAEAIMGTVRLSSNSMQLTPLVLPFNRAFNASDGTAAGASATPQSSFIPLDIEVIGGAIIDVFATTTQSVTGNADATVFIAYE